MPHKSLEAIIEPRVLIWARESMGIDIEEVAQKLKVDACPDILRFTALAEHYTRFRVDYLSPSGAIKFYYPDFVAIQKNGN